MLFRSNVCILSQKNGFSSHPVAGFNLHMGAHPDADILDQKTSALVIVSFHCIYCQSDVSKSVKKPTVRVPKSSPPVARWTASPVDCLKIIVGAVVAKI